MAAGPFPGFWPSRGVLWCLEPFSFPHVKSHQSFNKAKETGLLAATPQWLLASPSLPGMNRDRVTCLPLILGSPEHLIFEKNPRLPEKGVPKQALALDHPASVWWWEGGSPGQKCGLFLIRSFIKIP